MQSLKPTSSDPTIRTTGKNHGTPCIGYLRNRRKFFVPFYQRGYRWEKEQVVQLLNDIKENTEQTRRYSLQPIVVSQKVASEGEQPWELIDGQQRLTTLNLILQALGEKEIKILYARHQGTSDEPSDNSSLKITQQLGNGVTCEEDWSNLKKSDPQLDTVDNHHIVNAWLAIKTWLGASVPSDHFMKSAILCRTTVIWHEVDSEYATSEFLRFNTGKIPLSPCELLKAQFLATFNPPMEHRLPTEIAAEWDQMESAFYDEELWNFLHPPAHITSAPNRIALLFELLQPSAKDDVAGKAYFDAFPKPDEVIDIQKKWMKVRKCFLTLQEWFADPEIRHLVGFLRWSKTGGKEVYLGKLWSQFEKQGRAGYRVWLLEQVRSVICPGDQMDRWEKASYKVGNVNDYLQDVLLWFNVSTLPPSSNYPFARHASVKTWSLEHIHAQSSPDAANRKQFEEWKDGSKERLEHLKIKSTETEKIQELLDRLEALNLEEDQSADKAKALTENARQLAGDLETLLPNPIGEDLGKIWNLALLGTEENSSLSNRYFHQKREKVLDFEKKGRFVPPATVRVFLKAYSTNPDDLMLWDFRDRDTYKKSIGEIFETITKKGASDHV